MIAVVGFDLPTDQHGQHDSTPEVGFVLRHGAGHEVSVGIESHRRRTSRQSTTLTLGLFFGRGSNARSR